MCYYKKLAELDNKKAKCYALNARDETGKYLFDAWIAMSISKFKRKLLEGLDNLER